MYRMRGVVCVDVIWLYRNIFLMEWLCIKEQSFQKTKNKNNLRIEWHCFCRHTGMFVCCNLVRAFMVCLLRIGHMVSLVGMRQPLSPFLVTTVPGSSYDGPRKDEETWAFELGEYVRSESNFRLSLLSESTLSMTCIASLWELLANKPFQ